MQPEVDDILRRAEGHQRAGDLDAAAPLFEDALRRQPGNLRALEALGQARFQQGRFADAERIYAEALRRTPNRATAAYNLGCTLWRLKRTEEALRCFDQALVVDPNHLGALVNRSTLLQELERSGEALADCDRALGINPAFVPALVNRGNALLALGKLDDAFETYARALEVEPGAPGAEEGRAIVRFERGEETRAPVAFLERLYAKFSAIYDKQMLGVLGYCGHTQLRHLADGLEPPLQAPLKVWDLGCGTGLAGMAFKEFAVGAKPGGRLDGVDLSPPMLEAAKARGVYDSLWLADINAAFAQSAEVYDLVLAADTLIYFGDIAPFFRDVASHLKPGGRFLFTTESAEDGDWRFGATRRYQHARPYIERVSEDAGFSVEGWTGFTLRTENTVPVPAFGFALRLKDRA